MGGVSGGECFWTGAEGNAIQPHISSDVERGAWSGGVRERRSMLDLIMMAGVSHSPSYVASSSQNIHSTSLAYYLQHAHHNHCFTCQPHLLLPLYLPTTPPDPNHSHLRDRLTGSAPPRSPISNLKTIGSAQGGSTPRAAKVGQAQPLR